MTWSKRDRPSAETTHFWSRYAVQATWVSLGVLLLVAASKYGCTEPCSPTSLDDDVPSPAIECAAGQLCYQGSCIDSCNAGQERSEDCNVDDDCPSARPICNRSFCSACDEGQTCVPTLNLCRVVNLRPTPEPPPMPTISNPKFPIDAGPLDGSAIDPGLSLEYDAGVANQPNDVEVTHVIFVDIAQYERHLDGVVTQGSLATVRAFAVAGNGVNLRWRSEFAPPLIECQDDDDNDDGCGTRQTLASDECIIQPLRTATIAASLPTPIDLGDVRIEDTPNQPNSIATPIELSFQTNMGSYEVERPNPLPDNLLVYSQLPSDQNYILVSGDGLSGLLSLWPIGENAERGHHVPFRLVPSAATLQNNLERRPVITNPPNDNLLFQWTRIDSGTDTFEFVYVRITGNEHELSCLAVEGQNGTDSIEIAAGLLAAFRSLEGPGDYPLDFERSNRVQLLVNSGENALVEPSVRVRHTFQSEITFE